MQNTKGYIALGVLLVAVGILFLLQNFGVFGLFAHLVWVVLFGAGGLAFLWVFLNNREQWWAIIPGFTLLGIAGLIGLGEYLGAWGGALCLLAIGLSFWVIYAVKRDFWWAVIPAGTLTTLAVVVAVADSAGELAGGLFFLGLAATFGLVYLLPTPQGRMKWAWIPALVLAALGVVVLAATSRAFNYIWPAALVLVGGYLVLRAFTGRK